MSEEVTLTKLSNFWKVRDACRDIAGGLLYLTENSDYILNSPENKELADDYNYVKNLIDQITATGYFNKEINDEAKVAGLVDNIIKTESRHSKIIKNIWAKDISDANKFKQNDFKLCVKPLFAENLTQIKDILNKALKKSNFVITNLISNENIYLSDPLYIENKAGQEIISNEMYDNIPAEELNLLADKWLAGGGSPVCKIKLNKDNILPFGIVYTVGESFIAATDSTSFVNIKKKNEITDTDFLSTCVKGDEYLFLNNFGARIKTPKQLIKANSTNRFTQNENAVVLDGDITKPAALFYYSCGLNKISALKNILTAVAKGLNLPLIAIDMLNFYKSNSKFCASSAVLRKRLNEFINDFCFDIQQFAGLDLMLHAKKLVGLNTDLRYNFVFKYFLKLSEHIAENADETEEELKNYISRSFVKAVERHNELTKEREILNGAPLTFAREDMFVAVPIDFCKE